ncbi:hypothetical protein ACFQV2_17015 [Actinokineospora soli]|uniref:Major facilitator superfamily (MFS) profile domain-containing protein n=1 Tax=Actinokineospora soli TaxID=1048753 RepID=A0ABW2TMG3_9PSEU
MLLAVVLASWGVMALGGGAWLAPLVVGVIALDLGVQGVQVVNLAAVYRLRPEARSRITMAYTGTYFLGGAAGSAIAGAAYAWGGWLAVCGSGAVLAAAAIVVFSTR